MRSDSEPAILALKEAISREGDVEIELDEVLPIGDHQANWLAEDAVRTCMPWRVGIRDELKAIVKLYRGW